jgi:hypothetical protein
MNTHGGARAGAGRKPKLLKWVGPVEAAEQVIADKLPWILRQVLRLARGGPRVEEKWLPAALVVDARGVRVFPDLKPDELVLVERRVLTAAPDLRALTYLFDRLAGRPTERKVLAGAEEGEAPPLKVYLGFDPRTEL